MRLGLLTASLSREGGGLYDATRFMARALRETPDLDVRVFGLEEPHTAADRPGWAAVPVEAFPTKGPDSWGYSPALGKALRGADLDILHVHGLWMYTSVASLRWAQRRRRPYVVTPHGMLDAWALNNARWKKRVVARLFENAHLGGAACLHALCEAELRAIRAYGLVNPVCVIPNAIHLPAAASSLPAPAWRTALPADAKVLLYLGRLHAKKGLLELLRAWHLAGRRGAGPMAQWHLAVAGWDQGGFTARLEALAAELALDRVHFIGPQFGPAKDASYAASDAFVLPSFSEGLPMVVLEAWAHGRPVLMTPECNLPQGFASEAAIRVTSDPDGIAHGLDALFRTSEPDQRAMGARGRQLVERQFAWPVVAAEMRAVYDWVAGGGPKPDCVTA